MALVSDPFEIGEALRIHRSHPDDHFTILPNATLRDDRLGYMARGILTELISRPDNWQTDADALWRKAQNTRGERIGEGRRAMRGALAELERYGYLVRRKVRASRGRYVTLFDLFDTPGHTEAEVAAAYPADRGTANGTSVSDTSADETSASVTSLRSNDHQRTDLRSNDEEHSSALADARAADEKSSADDQEAKRQVQYDKIRALSPDDLGRSLLAFERKRKQVFSGCRHQALEHLEREKPALLDGDTGFIANNRLVLMYGVFHYWPEVPAWFQRLLEPKRSTKRTAA